MRARQRLERSLASFEASARDTVYQAFELAWGLIARSYGPDAESIETARLKLADSILAVVHEHTNDPQQLASLALQMMRINESVSERDLDDVPTRPPRGR